MGYFWAIAIGIGIIWVIWRAINRSQLVEQARARSVNSAETELVNKLIAIGVRVTSLKDSFTVGIDTSVLKSTKNELSVPSANSNDIQIANQLIDSLIKSGKNNLADGIVFLAIKGLSGILFDTKGTGLDGLSPNDLRTNATKQFLAASLVFGIAVRAFEQNKEYGMMLFLEAKSLSAAGVLMINRTGRGSLASPENARVITYQQALLNHFRETVPDLID